MMTTDAVPEFAIVGHPNEGKSAVVSTLAEDDSVRVSPTPGETIYCQTFPVVIDGRAVIRFTDTPGFQNPTQTLAWMKAFAGDDTRILHAFREAHLGNPDFRDDCELLKPIAAGAGVIYVVDGSRPVRNVDRAEMEILRLTGRPRMAIINCKAEETRYLEPWKNEFRKHFNAIRVFNAHKATYAERIDLLENLKSIDQDWQQALETVIAAFKNDWNMRNLRTADILCDLLADCLQFSMSRNFTDQAEEANVKKALQDQFNRAIASKERDALQRIRRLFKHNIFNYDLPAQSILHEELFSGRTWQLLGLTPKQLVAAAGLAGGAMGAALDLAAAGITFGVFTAIGGLMGAGWAAMGGARRMAKTKVVGLSLGGQQVRVGPIDNIQFLYVLLDRALIFYSHIINWAHGRRDYSGNKRFPEKGDKAGLTTHWDDAAKKACIQFFTAVKNQDDMRMEQARRKMREVILDALGKLSQSERRYGLILAS